MKEVVFEVKGKVLGKGRANFSYRTGRAYTPARTRLYERTIRQAFLDAGGSEIRGPVHVDFEATTAIQKSATKAQRERRLAGEELSLTKPDIDNIKKALYDALNGVAYGDDVNVVSSREIKGRYEEEARLIVRVREISPEEVSEIHDWMWGG